MVTMMQINTAKENYNTYSPLELCLLDEMTENGEVTTILKYDDESIILQQLTCKGVLKYKILPTREFLRLDKPIELPVA